MRKVYVCVNMLVFWLVIVVLCASDWYKPCGNLLAVHQARTAVRSLGVFDDSVVLNSQLISGT